MPGLARKILISAAADGLLLHPTGTGREREPGLRLAFGTQNSITSAIADRDVPDDGSHQIVLETYGIVGLLDLVKTSYLIAITRREQVAQIRGKAVYGIRDVALIPLASQAQARSAIGVARRIAAGHASEEEDEESEVETDEEGSVTADEDELTSNVPKASKNTGSVVKNIVQDRGKYGRFAERWFSTGGGWTVSGRRQQGMTEQKDERLTKEREKQTEEAFPNIAPASLDSSEQGSKVDGEGAEFGHSSSSKSAIETLTPRIVSAARLYFSSSGFYFCYDHDISRSLVRKDPSPSSTPLWKRFDPLYFWNRHLLAPFTTAGKDVFVLPLLQGFVSQRSFSIAKTEGDKQDVVADDSSSPSLSNETPHDPAPEKDNEHANKLLLTLISRRSTKRAGLRYLRRGIDEGGNVANTVETEQVLCYQSWDPARKSFSLVQLRGSIPLFFSQNPYNFKPVPTFFGSEATNQSAFKKHFSAIAERYGRKVEAVSLVDRHGNEIAIGESYEQHAKLFNENAGAGGNEIDFEWFDFHAACKGMRFENVSLLLDKLDQPLHQIGWSVCQSDKVLTQQSGVLRTNCMDCLDRTNVVQSAVGGWALQKQLAELGLSIDLQADAKTQWFNVLWADNGDAISKQYAGTSALKGDFTRTRKRNWTGALSDFSLTLNRYYNNLTSDYLLQTNIDYWLGNTSASAFDAFVADMANADPRIDLSRIRQNAIDTASRIILPDPHHETFHNGWTLSCPAAANTLRALPFEECLLLLTDAALYFVRFDWDAEKVRSAERVPLAGLTALWRGAFITSTLGATHTDAARNVGFALRYRVDASTIVRTNTRSIGNEELAGDENRGRDELAKQQEPEKSERRLLAFKALPADGPRRHGHENHEEIEDEGKLVSEICAEIAKAAGAELNVEERDVISVEDARRNTGFAETLGYNLKKLVWS
nr:phosphatidylinositide phosphatase sac2 [Quercus suber]